VFFPNENQQYTILGTMVIFSFLERLLSCTPSTAPKVPIPQETVSDLPSKALDVVSFLKKVWLSFVEKAAAASGTGLVATQVLFLRRWLALKCSVYVAVFGPTAYGLGYSK
jgi:hypothetical protein